MQMISKILEHLRKDGLILILTFPNHKDAWIFALERIR